MNWPTLSISPPPVAKKLLAKLYSDEVPLLGMPPGHTLATSTVDETGGFARLETTGVLDDEMATATAT